MAYNNNIIKAKAIQKENKDKLLKINPDLNDNSGIYFLTRKDENNINYFYIGQSLHILSRMCSHLTGYQHIDISLKKRKFYDPESNPYGWKLNFIEYPENELDKWEQHWIMEYTKKGYQCRYNKTAGGQGEGKEKINDYKPTKGYRDGIEQGKKNMARDLSHIASKHLIVQIKPEKANNKISQQAFEKFKELLAYGDKDEKGALK